MLIQYHPTLRLVSTVRFSVFQGVHGTEVSRDAKHNAIQPESRLYRYDLIDDYSR